MNPDMSDIRGEHLRPAIEAAELAVTHGHNLLLIGNPGIGKTMIARRVPGIMPELSAHERRWLAAEYGALGLNGPTARPFRAPHHTVSGMALVGSQPDRFGRAGRHAGEIRLARFGVLFIDELPEFRKAAIETLGHALRRMHGAPLIIASAAPCPCGWADSETRSCVCSDGAVKRYLARLKRAWQALDGHDTVRVPSVMLADLRNTTPGECSADIRARVEASR